MVETAEEKLKYYKKMLPKNRKEKRRLFKSQGWYFLLQEKSETSWRISKLYKNQRVEKFDSSENYVKERDLK